MTWKPYEAYLWLSWPRWGCSRRGGYDFAYFAFTVGTSFAVSDVDVTDDAMRQAVLGHQILSFFYNTSILATVVTMATG